MPVLIQAALNGGRTRAQHPGIPISPNELAQSAKESVAAGAGAIHFHVRAADGRETLDPNDVENALAAMRTAVQGIPIGVSTGAWIMKDTRLRLQTVSRWTALPDYASVNLTEDGAIELADLLLSRGVQIEAGLSSTHAAEILISSSVASKSLRLLIEPFEPVFSDALRVFNEIESILDGASIATPRMLHGLNDTAWQFIDEAATRGYETRIGFEDILALPDRSPAPSNAALVAEALRRAQHQLRSKSSARQ
jgi:uncharacterized protein (DUF849 family)